MVRIWAKVIKDNKIINQCVYENFNPLDYSLFGEYLTEICQTLDVSTPVLIKTHIFNYAKYNNVKFVKDDFIEVVDFDRLVLENALL